MINFSSALTATRRGIHQYGADWTTAIIAKNADQAHDAYHAAINILERGSLKIESASPTKRFIQLEKGGVISVYAVPLLQHAYLLAFHMFPQIIYVFTPPEEIEGYLRSVNRSAHVPSSDWRIDFSEL